MTPGNADDLLVQKKSYELHTCANHAGIRISWGDLQLGRLPHTNSTRAAEGGARRSWKFQTFP